MLCWSSREEIPHVQVKETQRRWQVSRGSIRGQTHRNHNHRKLVNLITWTTALSSSMKLNHAMWGLPRWVGASFSGHRPPLPTKHSWEAQSSPRVARESWGLRSSHRRAEETSPRRMSGT